MYIEIEIEIDFTLASCRRDLRLISVKVAVKYFILFNVEEEEEEDSK